MNSMLPFLLLVLAGFLARVVSDTGMCFFLFLLRFFCVGVASMHYLGELPFGWAFFCLFAFFSGWFAVLVFGLLFSCCCPP